MALITLGLSRIDLARLREPKITVRMIDFNAVGQVPFVESLLTMWMQLTIDIPSNVRVAAAMDIRTARRLRLALEGVLQVEELSEAEGVYARDGRRHQG